MAEHFSAETFDSVIASGTVLVDFWASWCGPCKMVAPLIEQLAQDYAGRATVGKVDVDEQPELAARYGIQSIPTVIVFKDGQPVEMVVGARPYESYTALMDKHL